MSPTSVRAPAPATTRVPTPVRWSVLIWLGAIAAGALEALVWTTLPDPPPAGALAVRFGVYAVLTALVLCLLTGRNAVRWALAVLLGGLGTLSLVVEPASWLVAGGSPADFLATADGPALLITGLRAAHLVAVFVALTLMFRPAATAFFRSRGTPA